MVASAAFLAALLSAPALAGRSEPDPLYLQITQTRYDSRISLGWQIRWQGAELLDTPRQIALGLGSALSAPDEGLRSLLWGTRFNLYGVRLKPFRRVEEPPLEKPAIAAAAGAAPEGAAAERGPAPAPAAPKASSRLRLEPDWEGLKLQGRRDLRRWVLTSVFDQVLPQARSAPRWQKEAAVGGLSDGARSWDAHPLDRLSDLPYYDSLPDY